MIPRETMATCNDCAMCTRPDQPVIPGMSYYQPDIKCCAFHPKLPNYLIGGLLLDSNPAMDHGRSVIREKIAKRIGVSPSGILPSKKYAIMHRFGERTFGKNYSLLCPYFVRESGLCGIWKFREAVCSTYFCKSVAGTEGKKFWNVLKGYLVQAQDALTWHCLLEMGWEIEGIWNFLTDFNNDNLDHTDIDELSPVESDYRKVWGDWTGREEELYKKSYEIVSSLSQSDFERLSGINTRIFLKWLKFRHHEAVSPVIPPVLRRNPELKAFPAADGKYIVKTDAGFFTVESALYEVIEMFDGIRTLEQVKGMVLEKWDTELEDDLLIPMFLNRMLMPVS